MPHKAKSKLTPELQDKILLHLRVGAYVETAAACAGIHKDTFYEWMKKGARGLAPYRAFADSVHKAVAESESRDLATILKAAQSQWQAAAWRLERRFPEKYGRNDRMKIDAKIEHDGASLLTKLARLIDGEAEPKKRGRPPKDGRPNDRRAISRRALRCSARGSPKEDPRRRSRRASARCSSSRGSSGRAPNSSSRRATGASGCCAQGVASERRERAASGSAASSKAGEPAASRSSRRRRRTRATWSSRAPADWSPSAPPWNRPLYEPSKRRLTWPNGAIASLYSADEPDRLRGPQHDAAWTDELAAWRYPEAWDQLMFGLRLGTDPRVVVTTTPRPTPLIRQLISLPTTVVTRGSTYENRAHLAGAFYESIVRQYEGTRMGRQELLAELLDDNPGALFRRDDIEKARVREAPPLVRIVVAVDPAVSSGESSNETGIVVAGLGVDAHAYVLADVSGRLTPYEWAQRAVDSYHAHRADRIIAERNQGGALVESNLRTVDPRIPYKGVTATRGKTTRAEPVAALYEQGRVHHVGCFPKLEDQMCAWDPSAIAGAAAAGARSDRIDALESAGWMPCSRLSCSYATTTPPAPMDSLPRLLVCRLRGAVAAADETAVIYGPIVKVEQHGDVRLGIRPASSNVSPCIGARGPIPERRPPADDEATSRPVAPREVRHP